MVSVSNTLNGVETHTSAELVRDSATVVRPLMAQVGGGCTPWLPGMRIKMVDGNGIEATEHRLKARRTLPAGALPGKSVVVSEPAEGLVTDVFPCEDGHAQEHSLDIIGFNQSRASSAHRMRGTGDDNSRGDCASRTQSP